MNGRALVGRERELQALDAAIVEAAHERRVLLFSGEPGIGKTRMLEELATRAVARHFTVAWGRMWEVGLTPPFWPWLQVLGSIETPSDPAPPLGSLDTAAGAAARLTRFGQVRSFLLRRAALGPLALLLDDLHAADLSSLELLEYLLPELLASPVLVAVAARESDASVQALARLARSLRAAQRYPLARLGSAEVEKLVDGRAPAAQLFALSEGNPLFVEELVASHRAHGSLGLPQLSSVRTVIFERVSRLPEPTRRALTAAAVVGRDFRGRVVEAMVCSPAQHEPSAVESCAVESRAVEGRSVVGGAVGGRAVEGGAAGACAAVELASEAAANERGAGGVTGLEVASRLQPALALGMVGVSSPDTFRFSHALVAEAIADALDPSERAGLHLAAAQAIARHTPSESAAIAHHLLCAGGLAAAAAVAAAERAARESMARLAFEDAAALLERALQALELAGGASQRRRAELLCANVEALQHAAHHGAAADKCDEAVGIVRALLGSGSESGSESAAAPASPALGELFARIALARGLELQPGRTDPRLVALLAEALERLAPSCTVLRAKLLARLAAAEQPARDPSGPVARALEAIELAAELEPRDRLEVMYVATGALLEYIDPTRLSGLHRQVLALARDQRWIATHTRLRMCFAALQCGDRGALEQAVAAFEAEAAALALPQWQRHVPLLRALVALLDGEFARAAAEAAQSEAISRALGDVGAEWRMGVHRAMAVWTQTAPVDVGSQVRLVPAAIGRAPIAAWFALQSGDRAAVQAALADVGSELPFDPDFAVMVGCAVAFAGGAARARQVYALLLARAVCPVLASMVGSAVFELYERVLLVLASAAGEHDAIDRHAAAALAMAESLASPVWVARVRADHADALERRGRTGDAERARELRALAGRAARRLGMPGLLERCGPSDPGDPVADEPPAQRQRPGVATPAVDAPDDPTLARARSLGFTRRGALWALAGLGEEAIVKDSRGVQMLARLVAEAGRPLHVLDLSAAGAAGSADGGDAGPALDRTAREQYRARLAALAEARDEAEALADRGRLERVNAEIDALGAELERAFGLGGRERRIGAASERARSNVQRRISHAIEQIQEASPRLGEHLLGAVRTGVYCVYQPRP
jgi:AAA ATPase-like protein